MPLKATPVALISRKSISVAVLKVVTAKLTAVPIVSERRNYRYEEAVLVFKESVPTV